MKLETLRKLCDTVLSFFVAASILVGLFYYWRQSALAEWQKRRSELGCVSVRAAPVIAALRRYTAERGAPPESLATLVPAYLPALPAPGPMSRTKEWFYRQRAADQPEGVWMLGIDVRHGFCPRCLVSFGDYFVYHSNQRYPQGAYGGGLEPVGAWGYYHE